MAVFIAVGAAVVAVALSIIFRPKVKNPRPDATNDFENPTAEAGRPYPILFGTDIVKGLNCIWWGDKSIRTYKTKA